MLPLRAALALVVATVALAGCGGSSSDGTSVRTTTSTSTAATRAAATPKQLLNEMATALAGVKSYHVAGASEDKEDGHVALSGDVSAAGPVQLRIRTGDRVAELIVLGKDSYIKANRAYWTKSAGTDDERVTALLSDRWISLPSAAAGTDKGVFQRLLPKRLAVCTTRDTSGIAKAGTGTVGGTPVVKLAQKGTVPGQAPGELSIAADGPALPLRMTQTGPEKPGGTRDPLCDDEDADSTTLRSDIRFSRFDAPVRITAPPGALDLSKLQSGDATQA